MTEEHCAPSMRPFCLCSCTGSTAMTLAPPACGTTRRRSILETSFNVQGGKQTPESSRNLDRKESGGRAQQQSRWKSPLERASHADCVNTENKSDPGCGGMKGGAAKVMGPKWQHLGAPLLEGRRWLGRVTSSRCLMVKGKKKQTKEISQGWRINNDKINSNHNSFHCKLQFTFQSLFNSLSKVENWLKRKTEQNTKRTGRWAPFWERRKEAKCVIIHLALGSWCNNAMTRGKRSLKIH